MWETVYRNAMHNFWFLCNILESTLEGTYTGLILGNIWDLAAQLWYFVVLGALISTLIWRFLPKTWVRQKLQKRVNGSIVLASLLGLVSPMCTFAAIPVVGTLIGMGVPAAPLVAFMISSPLMNPSLFVYTAGVISMEMAMARLLTALSVGICAGFAARLAHERGLLRFDRLAMDLVPQGLYPTVAGGADRPLGAQMRLFAVRFFQDLAFIGKYFLLGIFIAALVKAFLSEELVLGLVGPGSGWAVPAAVLLGVPLYACGGGSLPVVESMMRMGMTSGAALAFFIAGPATKFSTLSMLGAVFGRRLLGFYLAIMLTAALIWGYVYPFEREYLEVGSVDYEAYEGLIAE